VQLIAAGFFEAELESGGRDIGVRRPADLLTARGQTLDLFQLLLRC
jgi:hypothetical protein